MPTVNLAANQMLSDTTLTNYTVNGVGGNIVTLGDGTDVLTFIGAGSNTLTIGNGDPLDTSADTVALNGTGNNTITVNGSGNNTVTAADTGGDTITVGSGSNLITLGAGSGLDTVTTAAGLNTVFVSAGTISGDTLAGASTTGLGTTNVLDLTTAGIMSPARVTGFGTYNLANGGPNTLALVQANFTDLLVGSAITVNGGNMGNAVNAALVTSGTLVFNEINPTTGADPDIITGGPGNGADVFSFAQNNLSADTVAGNTGIDTLELNVAQPGGVPFGTVSGLGTTFTNLAVIDVNAGANWLFTATAASVDSINLAAAATAEFSGPVDPSHTINFTGAAAILKIDSATQFGAQINGFLPGETIDLTAVAFDASGTATLGAGNVLAVAERHRYTSHTRQLVVGLRT